MTAFDLIREGFNAWLVDSDHGFDGPVLTVVPFLFLIGFLAAAHFKSWCNRGVSLPERSKFVPPVNEMVTQNRESARLIELEGELDKAENSLKRLTETLSSVYANLSVGLAIFDADKSLHIFNPALSDVLNLNPVELARKPSVREFLLMLRENKNIPNHDSFLDWRRTLGEIEQESQSQPYEGNWELADGRVLRVTSHKHSMGATAITFEDISTGFALEKRSKLEEHINKDIFGKIADAIIIFDEAGVLKFANASFDMMFSRNFSKDPTDYTVSQMAKSDLFVTDAIGFWTRLRNYIMLSDQRSDWFQSIPCQDIGEVSVRVSTLPDGSVLVIFNNRPVVEGGQGRGALISKDQTLDPLQFAKLNRALSERDISLDFSGFDLNILDSNNLPQTRRVIWYLALAAANEIRVGGKLYLSSSIDEHSFRFACRISDSDRYSNTQENIAFSLLKTLTSLNDGVVRWTYDSEANPFEVSFKKQNALTYSKH